MDAKLNRRRFLGLMGTGAAMMAVSGTVGSVLRTSVPVSKSKPNILLILSDDMGFSDLGCYGGEIKTPNLDRLAANGLRFTQFYNTARCCPTRASLLTGLYPHQAGVGHMMEDRGEEGYQGDLNTRCVTIAEVLKPAGYSTYAVGKWHVTRFNGTNGTKHNWPLQRGFDRYYGTITGAGSYFDPATLTRDNDFVTPENDPDYRPERFFYTDAITDNALRFLGDHIKNKTESPFFMYMAYTAAHWPMHAKPEDIETYKGKYSAGWDALREERYRRMMKMGLIDRNWNISPRGEGIPAWKDSEDKEWHERRMEVYAAMVTCMDRGVGRIKDFLNKTNLLDNTLILFLQDNGGCAEENGSTGPAASIDIPAGGKLAPMGKDELQTQTKPYRTRDGRPVRVGIGVMPGPADTFVAYGKPWANASNTPFREYKHWVHEGGISTPLIVHWPGHIHTPGAFRHQPGHLIDIMATCVEVGDAQYPNSLKGNEILPKEGRSLVPAFKDQPIDRDALYWEHEGNRAVRQGKWKLVSKSVKGGATPLPLGPWELYDMEKDRTELNNLAEKYPDKAKDLSDKWDAYARRTHVIPWPIQR